MSQYSWRKITILFLFISLFIGLIFSHAIQSISVFLLCFIAFVDFGKKERNYYFHFSKKQFKQYLTVFKHPAYWILTFFFFYILIPFENCTDWEYLYQRVVIKLPFLFLPAAFLTYPSINKSSINKLFELLSILIILVFCYIFYENFQLDYNDILRTGKSFNTPGNHIRFSLIASFILITNFYFSLFENSKFGSKSIIKYTMLMLIFISVHLLAVRTGIIITYIGLITLTGFYIVKNKNYIFGIISIVIIALTPIIFYNFSSAFKNKIDYMVYDLNKYSDGNGANYADSGRLASLNTGWKIYKDHPLFGIGTCNIRPAVTNVINQDYPGYPTNLLPHSQFLFALVCSGIIGFTMLVLGLLVPFIHQKAYKNPFSITLLCCFIFLFMIDHLLEGTVGVGLFLFYTLLSIRYLKD